MCVPDTANPIDVIGDFGGYVYRDRDHLTVPPLVGHCGGGLSCGLSFLLFGPDARPRASWQSVRARLPRAA